MQQMAKKQQKLMNKTSQAKASPNKTTIDSMTSSQNLDTSDGNSSFVIALSFLGVLGIGGVAYYKRDIQGRICSTTDHY